MKQCSVCSKKGWFLRLRNMLCDECNKKLYELEREEVKYLRKINNGDISEDELKRIEEILNILKIYSQKNIEINIDINDDFKIIDEYKLMKEKENDNSKESERIEEIIENNVINEEILKENKKCNDDIKNDINHYDTKKNLDNEEKNNEFEIIRTKNILNLTNKLNLIETEFNRIRHSMNIRDINNIASNTFKIKDYYLPEIKNLLDEGVTSKSLNYYTVCKYVEEKIRFLEDKTKKSRNELKDFFNYSLISIQKIENANSYDIIEIAIIKVAYGKIIKIFQSYINPNKDIDDYYLKNLKLTNSILKTKPTIKDVFPQIIKFIGDDIVIGYDISKNIKIINDIYISFYNKRFSNRDLCLRKMYRRKYKEQFGAITKDETLETCVNSIFGKADNINFHEYDSKALNDVMLSYKVYEKLKYGLK